MAVYRTESKYCDNNFADLQFCRDRYCVMKTPGIRWREKKKKKARRVALRAKMDFT